MKVFSSQFSVLNFQCLASTLSLLTSLAFAAEPPVAFPDLAHYAPLWERSIFTTRDLPSPDAPVGPIFTDSLSLAGIYEVDGAVVAVIVDRTNTQIMEARIGSENEAGIKIRKVQPGASMDKARVQLQKGDQAGWISFGDLNAAPAETVAPAIPTRPAQPGRQPLSSPLLPPIQPEPAVPAPPAAAVSQPAPQNDVPLPPP